MKKTLFATCAAFIAVFLSVQCSKSPTQVSGTGSGTGNALVSGRLYDINNGSPAVGARVHFIRAGYDPFHNTLSKAFVVTDSTVTDSNGVYKTNNLDTGTFNVYGVGANGNLSLVDSLKVTGDTQVVKTDTLKGPASITGHIKLQPGDEPDKIIAIAMGSNTFSLISTAAQFSFANLAEGHYAVKFFSTLDNYSNYDTTFTITAGANINMLDSVVMPLTIPIPTGFVLKYDTLKQIVTLSWNRMSPAKVKGYKVYRQRVGGADSLMTPVAITDTVYVDSSVVQDELYVFRVASIDLGNTMGNRTSGDSITITSAYIFINNFGVAGTHQGQFSAPEDIAVDVQGNYWIADGNRQKIMKFNSSGLFLREFGDSGQMRYPYGLDLDPAGNIVVNEYDGTKVYKFDTLGHLLFTIDTSGTQIRDVSVDEAGNLYFSTSTGGNQKYIFKYNSLGNFTQSWQLQSTILHYAILARNGRVFSVGTIPSSLQNPSDQEVIEVFDTSGTAIQTVNIRRSGETGIILIRDLDIDVVGNVYAVDPENGKVRIFDSSLKYVTSFGKKGSGTNNFYSIQGIATSPDNKIAITDASVVHVLRLPQ
jgi:hypothetical protein